MVRKSHSKQPKHLVAAHGAEQAHQSDEAFQGDEAQASVDTEEFVSLRSVQEMLKVQESMLRALFDSVVKSLTARVDGVVESVNSLKASLEFSQKDIEELKPFVSKLEEAKDEIDQLNSDLAQQELKAEYLENQSRRNNIRIKGIAEGERETWDEVESKVKHAIKAKLDLDVDIERAHRVERRKKRGSANANEPRTIVCRLRDWKQREQVLRKARKEKPVGLHISEDIAFATLKKREAHLEKFKAAKQAGKIAYFVLDRLVIRDKSDD